MSKPTGLGRIDPELKTETTADKKEEANSSMEEYLQLESKRAADRRLYVLSFLLATVAFFTMYYRHEIWNWFF